MLKVFVSSPVAGLEPYREAVGLASRLGQGRIEFFMFEHYENRRQPGLTIVESILQTSGDEFDAFLMFFQDRLGNGTLEELDAFERIMRPKNPDIEVWWAQISCESHDEEVTNVLERFNQEENTGMPCVRGEEWLNHPDKLRNRVVNQIIESLGRRAEG
ncbi:hypothetical protein [uncultured Tateyamaria sp.]|uniref:hypothetical protein n=1 Tax=uncultured Tateyamaria sp. TaxID=455651 RepID=UPI00262CEB27|nr:hypothetical protein [uncultured Tateyamaria sp.]